MKTTNWQTKALALFIAAVALWLTTACGSEDLARYHYPRDGLRIVAWESCEIDVPLVPSQEFVRLADRRLKSGDEISYEALRKLPEYALTLNAQNTRLSPEFERIRDVLHTYRVQLEKYPHFSYADVEALNTWNGIPTDRIAVVVYLARFVDLREIRLEDQIPGCIAGVPVHIVVGSYINGYIE